MFQDFTAPKEPVIGDARLNLLRDVMKKNGCDALVVPHNDEQRNEYLPPCAERLAWLTGFTGSAGACVVTVDRAVLFVDGRYTLQAAEQVDENHIEVDSLIDNPPHKWLKEQGADKWTIGIDPWLHSSLEVKQLEKSAQKLNGSLKLLKANLVDAIWENQPDAPIGSVSIQPVKFAGRVTRDKLDEIYETMQGASADLCVLTDATSVSWLFNIRGQDVAHTPLVLAQAILIAGEDPLLFIDKRKLDMQEEAFLKQVCHLHPPSSFEEHLKKLSKRKAVLLDPALTPYAVHLSVTSGGGRIVEGKDPVALPRAVKNEAEITGSRNAHLRDGAAMATSLHWLDLQAPGEVDEITVARKLEDCRRELAGDEPLKDISFDTISGSGPNGAIVHYRVNEATNRVLQNNELYLTDSGGQYADGTTDITRTIAIGEPGEEERKAFTLVLKGHIAVALARFPKGTRGVELDPLARMALWQHGMDYAHGTGHGVGAYLAVHEGPQSISKRGMQALLPGMIVSNEPGYYKAGAFGIRIENLVLVEPPSPIDGGDQDMLGFETLTLAPIDTRLVDTQLLSADELRWLDAYHFRVNREIGPLVSKEVAAWLERATAPVA